MNKKDFENCSGNIAQQQLHDEFLYIVNQSANLYNQYRTILPMQEYSKFTADFADMGCNLNKQGKLEAGYSFADACHEIIEIYSNR